MSEDIKLDVIRSTQDSLSKFIKKPPLTEKLLRKPPFRYLHDIITAVMKETGYLHGLYSPDELNPENIKDRESKIAFLEKLIAAVNLSTGIIVTARPNKIVAGLDVAKTNELLQTIAKALEKKIDSSKAVEQVLEKKSKNVGQKNSVKKESLKGRISKDTKPSVKKTHESRTSEALKKQTKEKTKVTEESEPRKLKHKKDASPTKLSRAISLEEPVPELKKDDSKPKEEHVSDVFTKSFESPTRPQNVSNENEPHNEQSPPTSPFEGENKELKPKEGGADSENREKARIRPEKTEKENREPVNDEEERTEQKDRSIDAKQNRWQEDPSKPKEELKRPQSARAVHRKKHRKSSFEADTKTSSKNGEEKEESVTPTQLPVTVKSDLVENKPVQSSSETESKRPRTAARPASARPGAPRLRGRVFTHHSDSDKAVRDPVKLIVDSQDLPADNDDTLVTVEALISQDVVDQVDYKSREADQGHLVAQILETQKELGDTEPMQKVDISWGRERQETVTREVDVLRSGVQAVTRAANPLGTLIHFLQEDIDSMQSELTTWVASYQTLAKQLHAEQRLTQESMEPLARQLEEIDQLIEDQLEVMSVVKAAIVRNDEHLAKLLKTKNNSHMPG